MNFAGDVDQIHVTDPVQKTMDSLLSRIEHLEEQLDEQYTKNLENNYGFDAPDLAVREENQEKEN